MGITSSMRRFEKKRKRRTKKERRKKKETKKVIRRIGESRQKAILGWGNLVDDHFRVWRLIHLVPRWQVKIRHICGVKKRSKSVIHPFCLRWRKLNWRQGGKNGSRQYDMGMKTTAVLSQKVTAPQIVAIRIVQEEEIKNVILMAAFQLRWK